MAEVQLSTVVDLDLVKMKWREQYVSEGLNRKIVPTQPPGIYQGLRLIENTGSPRQVEVSPDADTNFHMAVYQSTTGYSLTYWDPNGTSIILDLSDTALNGQTTVIGLEMNYTIGVDTTAVWMAFPVADWDALPAARKNEIVVLGTVDVPVLVGDNILESAISFERATYAWRGLSKGTVPWSPVVKNGHFEFADDGTQDSFYWTLTDGGQGNVSFSSASPDSGTNHLRLANTASGSVFVNCKQVIAAPVSEGQLIMIRMRKQQHEIPSGGSVVIELYFSGSSGAGALIHPVTISSTSTANDGGYEEFLEVLEVPGPGVSILEHVDIRGDSLTYSSGPAILLDIDDVQVYLETSGVNPEPNQDRSGDAWVRGNLEISKPDDFFSNPHAQLSYDSSSQTLTAEQSDGADMILEVMGDVNAVAPTLGGAGGTVRCEQVQPGTGLTATDAHAEIPRIIAEPSNTAGVEYTLMWESRFGSNRGYRKYVNGNGTLVETVNAVWDNTLNQWTKDANGVEAFRKTHDQTGILYESQEGATDTWADGAWTAAVFEADSTGIINTTMNIPAYGNLTNTTVAGQLQQIHDGVHGPKTMVLSAGMANGNWDGSAGYRLGDADTVNSLTVGGTKQMSWTLPLHAGDRLLAVTVYGFAGNAAGEELQALIRRQNLGSPGVQVSTTKTSGLTATWANVGWTTSDTDFNPSGYTLVAGAAYYVRARIPQTSGGGEVFWIGLEITYDHP